MLGPDLLLEIVVTENESLIGPERSRINMIPLSRKFNMRTRIKVRARSVIIAQSSTIAHIALVALVLKVRSKALKQFISKLAQAEETIVHGLKFLIDLSHGIEAF